MRVKYIIISILTIGFVCCQSPNDCSDYIIKEHTNDQVDTLLLKGFSDYRDTLLNKFGETSIQELDFPAYHFMYYSAFECGKSIKFERFSTENIRLTVKCIYCNDSLFECHSYQIKINSFEWEKFQKLVDEFDFWIEEPFRYNRSLDGYTATFEGIRQEEKKCNAKKYQFVGRKNPDMDKIGSLFNEIIYFEESIDFRYHQDEL